MGETIRARESINQVTGNKISYNDFVIKAASSALRQHPKINSSWLGDTIRTNHHIHIGVAVAVDDGLLVPVVRFADSKTLSQINAEVKEFAQRTGSSLKQAFPPSFEYPSVEPGSGKSFSGSNTKTGLMTCPHYLRLEKKRSLKNFP